MIPRLILVGGPGGSGASTCAAAAADSLCDEGLDVAVVCSDARFGASTLVTHQAVTVIETASTVPSWAEEVLDNWAVDQVLAAELAHDIGRSGLRSVWDLPQLLQDHDRVVLDLGSSIAGTMLALHRLDWVLGQVGPLHRGWLRATRPVTALAMGPAAIGRLGARRLDEAHQSVDELVQLLTSSESSALLTLGDGPRAVAKLADLAAGVTLSQVRIGAVLGQGVTDNRAWKTHPFARQSSALGIPAWESLSPGWSDRMAEAERESELEGTARAGDVTWRIPLPFNTFQDVEVEQWERNLIVDVAGFRRAFRLPSLLERHAARSAGVRHGILEVVLSPVETDAQRKAAQ